MGNNEKCEDCDEMRCSPLILYEHDTRVKSSKSPMEARLQEDFLNLGPAKHRKVAIFHRKMSGFEVF